MVNDTIGVSGRLIKAGVGMTRQVERRAADTATRAADTATNHRLRCDNPGLAWGACRKMEDATILPSLCHFCIKCCPADSEMGGKDGGKNRNEMEMTMMTEDKRRVDSERNDWCEGCRYGVTGAADTTTDHRLRYSSTQLANRLLYR